MAVKTRLQGTDTLKRYGPFEVTTKGGAPGRIGPACYGDSGDFDADGVDDLIVAQGGGLVLHRGDINAFAPKTEAAFEAIRDLRYLSPFEEETATFALPSPADYISVGDFDRDSKLDVVAASPGRKRDLFPSRKRQRVILLRRSQLNCRVP
mgnify:CR=1 FL=1